MAHIVSVIEKNVAELVPYLNNARLHSRRQISQLKALISEFGFANPVLIDANDVVIAGHGRLIAAKELGLTSISVIQLDHLSAAQTQALRLADNKLALNGGGWDQDLLRIEIQSIVDNVDIDINITGFAIGEVNVILAPPTDPDDDVIPAVPSKPRTRLGDIRELGDHRVGCGDGRDTAFVAAVGQLAGMRPFSRPQACMNPQMTKIPERILPRDAGVSPGLTGLAARTDQEMRLTGVVNRMFRGEKALRTLGSAEAGAARSVELAGDPQEGISGQRPRII